ncbi:hypothetical protein DACRYDRAFT_15257 [Dacryopinax primogenitus]|uniref:BZIP domain-containing protein n=1 Tax=Dacryopinax primogenitus (strain DJM 731) TaxID=1858805 RepID=M5G9M3_DACPD|nr:uncharacterized protein DACRYDRAFT_15257 [Dacryopinax primogenitus]EJU02567.1 hypothetical protein DACRYDRAFT_15257 [Dacryopinax primogenitus]
MPITPDEGAQIKPALAAHSPTPSSKQQPRLNRNGTPNLPSETIAYAAYDGATRGKYDEGGGGWSGFRKGLGPDMLVPVAAPTESRTYYVESATSRRDGPRPAQVYRVKSPSTSHSPPAKEADAVDSSSVSDVVMKDDPPLTHANRPTTPPTKEESLAERVSKERARRRSQNTLAARRSRARKLETMLNLESERDRALARVAELEKRLSDALEQINIFRQKLNVVEALGTLG